jgi:hypothetical protein
VPVALAPVAAALRVLAEPLRERLAGFDEDEDWDREDGERLAGGIRRLLIGVSLSRAYTNSRGFAVHGLVFRSC